MLRRLLTGSNSASAGRQDQSRSTAPRNRRKNVIAGAEGSANRSEAAPMQSFAVPSKQLKMEDHIAEAQSREGKFEYVSIGATSRATRKSLLSSVLSARKPIGVTSEPLADPEPIICKDWTIEFPLRRNLPSGYIKPASKFVRLAEVIVTFTPTQSALESYSVVTVAIIDGRNTASSCVRSMKGLNTFGFDGRLSLDYFVHVDDLDFIKLTIELHNSVLSEGTVWGAIQLTLKLEQAAFPIQTAIEPAIMSLRMPDSTFKRMKTNPHHVDCTLDNADLDQLRDLYGKNKIIDYTRPVDRQEKIQAAMSEAVSEDIDERDRAGLSGPSSVAAWRSLVPAQTGLRSPPLRRGASSPSDMEGEWPSPVRVPDPDVMSLNDRPSPARKQVQFETVYDE
jgi:hypothetical protein